MARKKAHRATYGGGSTFEAPKGSGRWYASLRIDGRLERRRAADEQAAKAELEALRELKRKRIDLKKGKQTVADWFNAYHKEKARTDPKPRTVEFRRDKIEGYIIPRLGTMTLLEVRPDDIQSFLDWLLNDIRANTPYDGARTVHAVAAILQEAFTLAYERKLIPDNPYSGIGLPKYRRKKIEPLEDVQCRAFALAVAGRLDKRPIYVDGRGRKKRPPKVDTRLEALWMCYLLLGLRRGEGIGLRWEEFDQDKKTIRITQQIQRIDTGEAHQLYVGTPKTEDSARTLPVTRRLYALLCKRWEEARGEYALLGVAWTGQGLIFPASTGAPMWPDNIEAMFRRLRLVAGLPDTVKLHHLRHTLATLLDECGATETLKAGILGHAKETQTQKYTHARLEAMRKVLQAVEDRLFQSAVESRNESNGAQEVG